jgi:hypothetical protein
MDTPAIASHIDSPQLPLFGLQGRRVLVLGLGESVSGQYVVDLGSKCILQVYDASLQYWRNNRAVTLGLTFETIRRLLGDRPLVILSGYRTADYNSRLEGAASHSQHVEGV